MIRSRAQAAERLHEALEISVNDLTAEIIDDALATFETNKAEMDDEQQARMITVQEVAERHIPDYLGDIRTVKQAIELGAANCRATVAVCALVGEVLKQPPETALINFQWTPKYPSSWHGVYYAPYESGSDKVVKFDRMTNGTVEGQIVAAKSYDVISHPITATKEGRGGQQNAYIVSDNTNVLAITEKPLTDPSCPKIVWPNEKDRRDIVVKAHDGLVLSEVLAVGMDLLRDKHPKPEMVEVTAEFLEETLGNFMLSAWREKINEVRASKTIVVMPEPPHPLGLIEF